MTKKQKILNLLKRIRKVRSKPPKVVTLVKEVAVPIKEIVRVKELVSDPKVVRTIGRIADAIETIESERKRESQEHKKALGELEAITKEAASFVDDLSTIVMEESASVPSILSAVKTELRSEMLSKMSYRPTGGGAPNRQINVSSSVMSQKYTDINFPGANAVDDNVNKRVDINIAASASSIVGIVPLSKGGTGADLSATGGAGQFVQQTSAGNPFTVGLITASVITAGQALNKSDDTNVTLTLSGSPNNALLQATSITAGWNGQLAISRGGTNASSQVTNGVNYFDGTRITSSSVLTFNGSVLGVGPITATSITDSGLTAGRVTFATTGGLLTDDSDLTFSGDTLTATKLNSTLGTFTKTTAGDSVVWTNAAASNKTGYLYSDNTYVGLFGHGVDATGNGLLISATQILERISGTGTVGTWSSTGLGVTGNLTVSSGYLAIPAGQKFYPDGGGDSYIWESSANVIDIAPAGVTHRFNTAGYLSPGYVSVAATSPLYLDGGSDTYISESSANNMRFTVGANTLANITTGGLEMATGKYILVSPTTPIYFDNGSNTYIYEKSADLLVLVAGGSEFLSLGGAQAAYVNGTLVAATALSAPSLISTGAIGITPAAGSNLNVSLSTTGDFVVNTNQLYVDTSAASVGIGTTAPASPLHVKNADATALPVLTLEQLDVSEEMVEFITTIGTGNAIEAAGAKTLTTTHFVKVTIPGGLTRYFPVGTIA